MTWHVQDNTERSLLTHRSQLFSSNKHSERLSCAAVATIDEAAELRAARVVVELARGPNSWVTGRVVKIDAVEPSVTVRCDDTGRGQTLVPADLAAGRLRVPARAARLRGPRALLALPRTGEVKRRFR